MGIATVRGEFTESKAPSSSTRISLAPTRTEPSRLPRSTPATPGAMGIRARRGIFSSTPPATRYCGSSRRASKRSTTMSYESPALTIHGITNAVVLRAGVQGTHIDPLGNWRPGLEVVGQLSRCGLRDGVQPVAGQRQLGRRRQGPIPCSTSPPSGRADQGRVGAGWHHRLPGPDFPLPPPPPGGSRRALRYRQGPRDDHVLNEDATPPSPVSRSQPSSHSGRRACFDRLNPLLPRVTCAGAIPAMAK